MDAINRTIKKILNHLKATDMPQSIIAKDLLAFRTIITMLTYIQSQSSNTRLATKTPIASKVDDPKVLRVLDALSSVLIREHEITAVVAQAAQPYDGFDLQFFASVVYPSNTEPLLQPGAEPGGQSSWDRVCNFTIAVNPALKQNYLVS